MKIKLPLPNPMCSFISLGILFAALFTSLAAPRPPQPPWPQATLRIYGFDSAYAKVPWRHLAINEDEAIRPESWSGYSLSREGFISSPVVIPVRASKAELNVAPARGAIRFWVAFNWSTASKASGGTGPGHPARLLELVSLNSKTVQTRWSLFLNEAGDTISLAGETKMGAAMVFQAPVAFTAGEWRMISLLYSETNVILQLDTVEIATGAGLLAPASWDEKDLGLVVGSDILAAADSVADGQFEELTTMAHWPAQMDWQALYFKSCQRRTWLGPLGTKAEEQTKVMALRASGDLPEIDEENSGDGDEGGGGGPIAYSYAPGTLWLEITGVSNNLAHLIVHGTSEGVAYEIRSKESLTNAVWAGEQPLVIGVSGQDWTATTVLIGTRTNELFFSARSWIDGDGDGLPDWWEMENGLDPNNPDTGDTGIPDGYKDSDNDGWTNLQEYQNGTSPSQFNMPAAPHGFHVASDASGTHAKLSWLPASGPVTGYTIERGNGSLFTASSSAVQQVDTQTTLPSGWYYDYEIPKYRVRAEYSGAGSSWSAWEAVSDLSSPSAEILADHNGTARVVLGSIPASAAAVRVGDVVWNNGYQFVNSTVVPIAQFTNGVAHLPDSFVRGATNSFRALQFVLTNTATSAVKSDWYHAPGIQPFWDGRAQLKDNLRFLLRIPNYLEPFDYWLYIPPFTEPPEEVFPPPAYAHSSFWHIEEYQPFGNPNVFVDQFIDGVQPFAQNYLYEHFIFSPANVNSSGRAVTGVQWNSRMHLYLTNAQAFSPPTPANTVPSLLDSSTSRWCFLPTRGVDQPHTLGGLSWGELWESDLGVSTTETIDGPLLEITSTARNWFGLPYESFLLAWEDEFSMLETSLLTPSQPALVFGGGFFYPEVAQPGFQLDSYYFTKALNDTFADPPLPGYSDFDPTNTTPDLFITSVGALDFKLAGYAKLAVTNGYAGVYGYLGQYFDRAYQTTNGVVTTNETGILSPYGEFFPTEPGRTALVTMPDLETNERGTATVYVVSMNVDANHDGIMDRTFYGPDQTSASRPFRFWINNDRDPYNEDLQYGPIDCADGKITSIRDLEDFARLWISGLPALPAGNGYSASLSWRNTTGSPKIKIYPAAEEDGGGGYLTNSVTAQFQLSVLVGQSSPGQTLGEVVPGQTLEFPANYFAQFGRKHFLFEGSGIGTGELVLMVRQGTNTLAETSVLFELKDIKQLYERWTIGTVGAIQPVNTPYLATDGLPAGAVPFQYPHNGTTDTNTPYILHVHGWNMTTWGKNSYAETGFKRLYWQGYTGRYGILTWPTFFNFPGLGFDEQAFDLNNYDKSEWQAWKSGTGLRTLLTNLTALYPQRVRVTGHSMGNVVVGEALRISSSAPKLAVVYAALEAAIPSHCYDSAATNRAIPFLENNNTPNIYANYWQPGSSNYFYGFQGASKYVNFFNTNDFALRSWQLDQNLKPAGSLAYSYDQIGDKFYKGVGELSFPANTHEIFSFCSEPRCFALGAQPNVGGYFSTTNQVDLNLLPYDFGEGVPGHSGQFRFSNQKCWPFWDELLKALLLKPR